MSVIDNQEHLIAQTQLLYDELFNSGKFAEAIAIGKLILDLSTAYKELSVIYPPIAKSSEPSWVKSNPYAGGFGQSSFSQINQTVREVIPPLHVREERYKANQFSEPPQPSKYSWADGFQGVTVPPREVDAPSLPNSAWTETRLTESRPNNISSQPTDYWEDSRRQ